MRWKPISRIKLYWNCHRCGPTSCKPAATLPNRFPVTSTLSLSSFPSESPLPTPSPGGTPSLKRGQRRRNRFSQNISVRFLLNFNESPPGKIPLEQASFLLWASLQGSEYIHFFHYISTRTDLVRRERRRGPEGEELPPRPLTRVEKLRAQVTPKRFDVCWGKTCLIWHKSLQKLKHI